VNKNHQFQKLTQLGQNTWMGWAIFYLYPKPNKYFMMIHILECHCQLWTLKMCMVYRW